MFDGRGNYFPDDEVPEPNEQTTIPPPQYSGDTVLRGIDVGKLVDELVLLRALASRLKTCLKTVRPYITSPTAQKRVNRAIDDDGGLPYEIH